MSGAPTRLGALVALLALVACTSTTPEQADGSGGAQPGEGSAAAAVEAPVADPAPVAADDDEKPPENEAAPPRQRPVPLLEAEGEMDATEWVAHAVYRSRMVATNHLLHRFERAAVDPGSDAAVAQANLRILFASNVAGELVDCGCRRNPLGGLARRAQLAQDWGDDGLAMLHLDAGNALLREPMFSGEAQREQGELGAKAMLDAFGLMELDALAVGWRDIALGAAWLQENASAAGVPLVTANWMVDGAPLGSSRLRVERDGRTVGVTAVSPTEEPTSGFFARVGVVARDPVIVADDIRALRDGDVDLVVLIVTGGVDAASALIPRLAEVDARPDLVLVSGSRRTMREAAWVDGVPVVESSDRGRNLVAIDVGVDERFERFQRGGDDLTSRLRQTRTTLQAAEGTANRLRAARADQAPEQRLRTFELLRRRQHRQLTQQLRALATLDPGDAEGWTLAVHLRPVPLDAPEDAAVKARVDAALEAGWEPPHDHH